MMLRPSSSAPSTGRAWLRRATAVGAVAALAITAAACGDDDESAEDRFCAAGDALEADVAGLASVDIVSGGLDALEEQYDAVADDVDELRDAGTDVAADELDALDASTDALGDALSELGGEITTANATAVATAVDDVASAAAAVFDVLANTCP